MCEVRFLPPGETIGDAILRGKRLWRLALIFSDSLENRTEEKISHFVGRIAPMRSESGISSIPMILASGDQTSDRLAFQPSWNFL